MIVDVFGSSKKHIVMADTWGHLYPEPGSKHYGEMIISVSEYGDESIVKTDFPGLDNSPMRYALEQTIFDLFDMEPGVYKVQCGMWFFKTVKDMYLGKRIGRLINVTLTDILT